MSYLFNIKNNVVYPNTETLLISPFKEIWERDKSKNKTTALKEFAYIEFMTSYLRSNPFRQYPDNVKESKIISEIIRDDKWRPDTYVKQALQKIEQFQEEASTTYTYYLSVKNAAENMKDFFNTVDLNKKNIKTGAPLYKPADLTRAFTDTNRVLSNLKELEKKVEEELYEEVKTRSDKKISIFAKRESIKR